jgi:hypothetical protein
LTHCLRSFFESNSCLRYQVKRRERGGERKRENEGETSTVKEIARTEGERLVEKEERQERKEETVHNTHLTYRHGEIQSLESDTEESL